MFCTHNHSLVILILAVVTGVASADLPPVHDPDCPSEDRAEGLEHNWLIKLSDNVTRDDIEQMCSEASNANVTFTQKARAMGMHMHAARARAQAADEAPGVDWSKRQSAQSVRRFGKECVRRASRMGVLNVVARDDVHLQEIRNVWSDSIEYIEPNYKVSKYNDYDYNFPTKSWALDRIDQVELPLDGYYDPPEEARGGKGVHVYIVDTGVRKTHQEFQDRIGEGVDFIELDFDPNDCNGHGTHCAGVVGGYSWGVAKQVTMHAVRVLDCDGEGSTMDVISGLEWILDNHPVEHPGTRAVVSMSLGGLGSGAMNHAVTTMVSNNYPTTVAAGNEAGNACYYSPSSARSSISVGSSDELDQVAKFSNYGRCVDLFAPGTNILSAGYTSDTSTMLMSGTSCSAPLVSGAAALYLELNPDVSASDVGDGLVAAASMDQLMTANLGAHSPNAILNVAQIKAQDANSIESTSTQSQGSEVTADKEATETAKGFASLSEAFPHLFGASRVQSTDHGQGWGAAGGVHADSGEGRWGGGGVHAKGLGAEGQGSVVVTVTTFSFTSKAMAGGGVLAALLLAAVGVQRVRRSRNIYSDDSELEVTSQRPSDQLGGYGTFGLEVDDEDVQPLLGVDHDDDVKC